MKTRRCLAVLAVLALSAACASTKAPGKKTLDVVRLRLEKQQTTGNHKGIPSPEHLKVYGYVPLAPDSEVHWSFRHKETTITFDDKRIVVSCNNEKGCKTCTATLPPELAFGTKYKYTITGKDDEDKALDINDPDIEVYP